MHTSENADAKLTGAEYTNAIILSKLQKTVHRATLNT